MLDQYEGVSGNHYLRVSLVFQDAPGETMLSQGYIAQLAQLTREEQLESAYFNYIRQDYLQHLFDQNDLLRNMVMSTHPTRGVR